MSDTPVVVRNPILRGFNPDPSIVRVGDEFFVATSTFEWFPGVRIHRSRDLANWEVVGHALDESNGFDLRGVPDSGGVWAPSLSYADGHFWLAYSIIRTMDGDDKDLDNYLVTATDVSGPWSRPIHLGSRGFDFSFFHDTDGTHWVVGVQWDQRPEHPSFSGIVLEQYLPDEQRVSGEAVRIYSQPSLVEGPNLYRFDDGYHLLLAEGGTGWNHGITMARSASREGPFVRDEAPAVLTSRDDPGTPLQKAGHGELVSLPGGGLALVHLASRPALWLGERYSTLGRETCIQRVVFDAAGWLRLEGGGHHGRVDVPFPELEPAPVPARPTRDDFDAGTLDVGRWSTLRCGADPAVFDLASRPGWLRIVGGHSVASVFDQSMIAQRVEELEATVETLVDAEPTSVRQAAGLVAWYNRSAWIWLQLTWDAEHGRHLRVVVRDRTTTTRSEAHAVGAGPVGMRMSIAGGELRFSATGSDGAWGELPGVHPAYTLSDDHGGALRFTGMFAGVRADDLDGLGWSADVDYVDAVFRDPRAAPATAG